MKSGEISHGSGDAAVSADDVAWQQAADDDVSASLKKRMSETRSRKDWSRQQQLRTAAKTEVRLNKLTDIFNEFLIKTDSNFDTSESCHNIRIHCTFLLGSVTK